ncbi:MAG: MFS transporter [Bacteroidaceae bacterium]|nr:MFS transporter [Bacteroidaceae bacterium]
MAQKKSNSNIVAIVTMCFIFAMISFVTNMAAPFGNIWKGQYEWAGMMGNMMNFAAYLFMGIPAGKMLLKIGYKKTTLAALAVGFIGVCIEYISSFSALGGAAIYVYLLGAFVCGFCVCMLNTVVNPMLNMLGGGGNRGNQLIQTGGTLNSLTGTLTPFFIGILIGTVTKKTTMAQVAPLLFIAMGVFAVTFIIISFLSIPEPAQERKATKFEHSAWKFRHFVLGAIAIFFYVGIEIGIPAQVNFFLSDPESKGAGILVNGALIGGAIAAVYWFLMMVGRFCSTLISGKVSTKTQLVVTSSVAILLIVIAIFTPKTTGFNAPKFIYNPESKTAGILIDNGMSEADAKAYLANPTEEAIAPYLKDLAESFNIKYKDEKTEEVTISDADLSTQVSAKLVESQKTPKIPYSTLFLVLCGLCTSVMWGAIFNLAVEGLGKYTEQASGIFMTLVVGGGVMPLIQEFIAKSPAGYMNSYWLVVAMLVYLLYYALVGCKNVNKDIPVD